MPILLRVRWALFSFLVLPADIYIRLIGMIFGVQQIKTAAVYMDENGNMKDIQ